MTDWDIDSPAKGTSSGPVSGPAAAPQVSRENGPPPAGAAKTPAASPQGLGIAAGARKRRLPISVPWLIIVALVLLAGLLGGFFIGRGQYSGDSAALADTKAQMGRLQQALTLSEDRNWTYYRQIEGLKGELAQAAPSTTVPSTGGVRTSYSDGVYLVGTDIPAGTYDGVVNGTIGYWARLKTTDGTISSIIENAIPKGPFVLTVVVGDEALELRGVTIRPH
jgi:hypothetical protein